VALIEISHLSKIYKGDGVETIALNDVSLEIQKGEFLAIMGPSGSGKSTLLHVLGFLDVPSRGDYRFDGKKITEYTKDEIAHVRNRKLGFIFQAFNLLPNTSVLENVKLPLLYSNTPEAQWDRLARNAIDAVGLGSRLSYEPAQLSGGEKQRVAIARALVTDPDVIFADEPTGNLDSKSGQMVMEIIQELNDAHGHTIILVTHETYTAELARRIIRMQDGKISSDEVVSHRLIAKEHFEK